MQNDTNKLSLINRINEFHEIVSKPSFNIQGKESVCVSEGMDKIFDILLESRNSNGSVFIIGNGGSASIASHVATDFVKVAKLRTYTLHDSSLMTCMSNDYGYENAFSKILSVMAKPNDVLIAISSSGNSLNIINAVNNMKILGGKIVTLSGFNNSNPLRISGNVNIWLDSSDYGFVEIGHQFILHNIADRFSNK